MSLLSFEGCRHCGGCGRVPHACARAPFDDCEAVFARLAGASFIVFVAPIYNYGLPAQFKALVDRSQRFYEAGVRPLAGVPAGEEGTVTLTVEVLEGALQSKGGAGKVGCGVRIGAADQGIGDAQSFFS